MKEEQRSWDRLLNFEVPICVGSLHFRAQSLTVKSESEALQDRHARGSSMLLVTIVIAGEPPTRMTYFMYART